MNSLHVRKAEPPDLPSLAGLSASVGFNQTAIDWQRYLALEPDGCFVGVQDDRVVASSIGANYAGKLGWVGMVVVHPDHRRGGYGSLMTSAAIDYLTEVGCPTIGLDARAAGVAIYQRLGFESTGPVQHWERDGADGVAPNETPASVRAAQPSDLAALARLDGRAFGADRGSALHAIGSSDDSGGAVVERGGTIAGFRLSRQGIGPVTIGPVIADSAISPEELRALLIPYEIRGPVAINIFPHEQTEKILTIAGFRHVFDFQRMYRGTPPRGSDDHMYRVPLGPEWG